MFKIMMKNMGKVENKMDGMAAKVDNAAQLAKEAKAAAQEANVVANAAKEAAAAFGGAVEDMKKAWAMKAVIKDELPAMVKGITATMVDPWAQAAGKGNLGKSAGKGKESGKTERRAKERTHTISFSNFPKGSRAPDIQDFIKKSNGDTVKIEEVYTYDERTTKGMARFETEDAMWQYMKSDVGKQRLEFRERRIYTDTPKGGEDAKQERAVRKTIQLFIKHGGGDADAVKKELDISYRQGSVWKGETQLAEWSWKAQEMTLMGEAANFTIVFNALMKE